MKKPNKQVIIDFIVSCLESGEQRKTILAKVGKRWQVSPRSFDRMLKISNEQQSERQELASKAASRAYVAKKEEAAIASVMSKQERLELLTKIAKGEIEDEKKKPAWNNVSKKFEIVVVKEKADHIGIIKAIAELNKMEGDYAPVKTAQTDTSGNDLPPSGLTDSQFEQFLASARANKTTSGQ